MPTVSVILPTYNSSRYIVDTVNAILDQSFTDFEIIVADDCSTDDTLEKIARINSPKIRVYKNEQNMGIPYTHNKLLDLCTGDYIAIQDHDDISYPYRLQIQTDFLKENPDFIATCSFPTYIDSEGKMIMNPKLRWLLRTFGLNNFNLNNREIFSSMLFKNNFCHSTIMLNRKLLGSICYSPDHPICDDYELLARLTERFPVHVGKKPVLKYRMHLSNTNSLRYVERENDIASVQSRLIEKLGLTADKNTLYIHSGYYNDIGHFKPEIDYLKKSIDWYQTILAANRQQEVFEDAALKKAIELNWFERCFAHKALGMPVVQMFRKNHFDEGNKGKKLIKSFMLFLAVMNAGRKKTS